MLQTQGTLAIGKSARRMAILIALAVTVAMSIWMSAGPVSKANADSGQFCWYVLAQPYGWPYDRCSASVWATTQGFEGATVSWEHSTCIATLNAAEQLNASWVCTGGPNTVRWTSFPGGTFRRPIVRNNTTGDYTHIGGFFQN